jgi:predicted pyridoxine 5'-phosphate oxidase superfamily flavin-nucleotide-binding protein
MSDTIFHPGEEYIQRKTGERNIALRVEPIVDDILSRGAIQFLESQGLCYVSSVDESGLAWASVLSGRPGFLTVDSPGSFTLDPELVSSDRDDAFWKNIQKASGVGFLFIELMTRRRYRINGKIRKEEGKWIIEVDQAYPNCPKYIQRRTLISGAQPSDKRPQNLQTWLSKTDTIFVASSDLQGNLDASHRGGHTGFITYINETTFRIPEYVGNSMFNTLGNFHVNPIAGILIVDYGNGDTLQMTGRVTVHLNVPDEASFTGGTNRYWEFEAGQFLYKKSLFDFTTHFVDYSPFNP